MKNTGLLMKVRLPVVQREGFYQNGRAELAELGEAGYSGGGGSGQRFKLVDLVNMKTQSRAQRRSLPQASVTVASPAISCWAGPQAGSSSAKAMIAQLQAIAETRSARG